LEVHKEGHILICIGEALRTSTILHYCMPNLTLIIKLLIPKFLDEGCYYVSIGVWAHESRILHTYVIGVYTIEIVYDYRVYMLQIPLL